MVPDLDPADAPILEVIPVGCAQVEVRRWEGQLYRRHGPLGAAPIRADHLWPASEGTTAPLRAQLPPQYPIVSEEEIPTVVSAWISQFVVVTGELWTRTGPITPISPEPPTNSRWLHSPLVHLASMTAERQLNVNLSVQQNDTVTSFPGSDNGDWIIPAGRLTMEFVSTYGELQYVGPSSALPPNRVEILDRAAVSLAWTFPEGAVGGVGAKFSVEASRPPGSVTLTCFSGNDTAAALRRQL